MLSCHSKVLEQVGNSTLIYLTASALGFLCEFILLLVCLSVHYLSNFLATELFTMP